MARSGTVVVGVGNLLLGDEGVGIHAVRELERCYDGADVEFVDGGTSGHELLDTIADRQKLIIVDAGDIQGSPGTIQRLGAADLLCHGTASISIHEFGLAEALREAGLLGLLPGEIVILAVKPQDIQPSMELSLPVKEAMPHLIRMVLAECRRPA